MGIFPKVRGENKNVWNHHLVIHQLIGTGTRGKPLPRGPEVHIARLGFFHQLHGTETTAAQQTQPVSTKGGGG